jgi:aryl-phospho-beta-D-glucosidase BglC (GH1 family)
LIVQRHSTVLVSVLVLAGGGCNVLAPSSSAPSSDTSELTGCTATPGQPIAPGGYWVNGNTICTASGREHLFHGVDRPSLEWSPTGQNLSAHDFQLMAGWKANVVRLAMFQDYWLPGSQYYDATYADTVDKAVHWAEAAGMDVILDLHWSDKGVLGSCDHTLPANMMSCQQIMADVNSKTFWSQVAAKYASDGRVQFELYNEPHDVSWDVWKSGGMTGGFMVVGMQELYDTVRAAGANNLVIIGGLNYAYDLSGVKTHRISGYNIAYATHPYASSGSSSGWPVNWGYLTATDPVIVTEFGDRSTDASGACSSNFVGQLIPYADQHHASWTAWAWFPGGCTFPSIITDWNGTASPPGAIVKSALMGYHDPAAGGAIDAGTSANDGGSTDGSSAGDGSSQ